jgi:hypothetical protein
LEIAETALLHCERFLRYTSQMRGRVAALLVPLTVASAAVLRSDVKIKLDGSFVQTLLHNTERRSTKNKVTGRAASF